jgi:hypothetical protein
MLALVTVLSGGLCFGFDWIQDTEHGSVDTSSSYYSSCCEPTTDPQIVVIATKQSWTDQGRQNEGLGINVSYTIGRWEINVETGKMRTYNYTDYDFNGKQVRQTPAYPEGKDFTMLFPGTMGEHWVQLARQLPRCNR